MISKKKSKKRLAKGIFGVFLTIIAVLGLTGGIVHQEMVYADPNDGTSTVETQSGGSENGQTENSANQTQNNNGSQAGASGNTNVASSGDGCKDSLGAIGWLVCPTTGAIAGAVDFLYGMIQDILVINPVEMKDGMPIYEIWKYCRGFANIVFIIFLLVVIYSQITGVGISNYLKFSTSFPPHDPYSVASTSSSFKII